jgi:ankyrin repeat protein
MNLPQPPPHGSDPIITQFKPVEGQWELNDENIKRIDPKTGQTILHNYCRYVNTTPLGVYRYLIETLGCNVNAQDNNCNTPLYYALCCFNQNKGGDIVVLTYFFSQEGINTNIKDRHGCTLLHTACHNIDKLPIEVFKFLIEAKGGDVDAQNNYKDTPLHYALRYFNPNGDITALNYLLSQEGVKGNSKDRHGDTLLHYACKKINKLPLDLFKLLIETHGADVHAQNNYKNTPLYYALCDFDSNDGGDITVLMYLLTQMNINVNTKGYYGETLLHYACGNINTLPLEIFKLLIEKHGSDVNVQDNEKDTPLHQAITSFRSIEDGGNITVLTYLLSQKGGNDNTKDKYGCTLLHLVCKYIHKLPIEIFKLLIETLGYDVNAQDDNDDTPLHQGLCCFNPNSGCNINVLTYLINQTNININIKYKNGYTLLHSACIIYLSNTRYSAEQNAECDAILCQIVEVIVERCVQEVFDEEIPLEATTTM